ncbi:MAG: glycine cleavage system protein GcvH [Gemmatimonadota bacterium]|nr:glycine cleavage system protein GcvH [Gemmatimonadota bacterium]
MSDIPSSLHYTEDHEYVRLTDDPEIVAVGITDYAQGELGDVVYVELPEVGLSLTRMDEFGTIEAVKAVSPLYAPVPGEVVEINEALEGDPSLVNKDPYGEGWMIKVRIRTQADLKELLTAADYQQHIGE